MCKKERGNTLIIGLAFTLIGIFMLNSILYFTKRNIKENSMLIKDDRDFRSLKDEDYIILEDYCYENNLIVCENEEELKLLLESSNDKRVGKRKITARPDLMQIKYYLNIWEENADIIYFNVVLENKKIILREDMVL